MSSTSSPTPIEANDIKRARVISSPVNDQEWIVPPTPNIFFSSFYNEKTDNQTLLVQGTPERELLNNSTIRNYNDTNEEEEDYRSDFSCFSPIIQKHQDQTINIKTTTATTVFKPSTTLVTRVLYRDAHVSTTNKEIPVTNNTATIGHLVAADDDDGDIKSSISCDRSTKSTPNDS
jgi:hypothetical protein